MTKRYEIHSNIPASSAAFINDENIYASHAEIHSKRFEDIEKKDEELDEYVNTCAGCSKVISQITQRLDLPIHRCLTPESTVQIIFQFYFDLFVTTIKLTCIYISIIIIIIVITTTT